MLILAFVFCLLEHCFENFTILIIRHLKSFLQETAEDIVEKFGSELSKVEIIFPNKRTDFHFKKCLGQALNKTSWSPKTYTIQHYISQLTGLKTIDKISLLFELFDSFKQIDKTFNPNSKLNNQNRR